MPAVQVSITLPKAAVPGAVLSIPVKGGSESVKVRVPDGVGPGSALVLTQTADGGWAESFTKVVPPPTQVQFQEEAPPAPVQQPEPVYASQGVEEGHDPIFEGLPNEGPAYTVRLETTVGHVDIIVRPDWAPHGARRFLELAAAGDLDDLAFYRAVRGCLAQFGLPARREWPPLPDDPPCNVPFLFGAVCFAAVGENSRRSTLFICIGDMSHCLGQSPWETPIGAVTEESLEVLNRICTVYGDIAEYGGAGPDTGLLKAEGNAYLRANFGLLTYVNRAWPMDWSPEMDAEAQAVAMQHSAHAAAAPAPAPDMYPDVSYEAPPAVHFQQGSETTQAHSGGPCVIDVPIEIAPSPGKRRPVEVEVEVETVPSNSRTRSGYASPMMRLGKATPQRSPQRSMNSSMRVVSSSVKSQPVPGSASPYVNVKRLVPTAGPVAHPVPMPTTPGVPRHRPAYVAAARVAAPIAYPTIAAPHSPPYGAPPVCMVPVWPVR